VEGVVKSSESNPGIDGHVKGESRTVGATFLEKVDPFVVSGWVGKELGAVESVKVTCSGLVICFFFCPDGAGVTQLWSTSVSCFALMNRVLLKGVIDFWSNVNCGGGAIEF
jgi:hypothetical protein